MGNILRLAHHALTFMLRGRFFWIWNSLLLLLVLSLNRITLFEFEAGGLVPELFLTTLTLSAGVNLLVFYLNLTGDLNARRLDLLAVRPTAPHQIVVGTWTGAIVFQLLVSIVLGGAFLWDSYFLGRAVPRSFWPSCAQVALQIGMLAAFFSALAVLLKEFWAFCSMVGGFLLGHLAEQILLRIPAELSLIGSVIFSFIPDLVATDAASGGSSLEVLWWRASYGAAYTAVALLTASIALEIKLYRSQVLPDK